MAVAQQRRGACIPQQSYSLDLLFFIHTERVGSRLWGGSCSILFLKVAEIRKTDVGKIMQFSAAFPS